MRDQESKQRVPAFLQNMLCLTVYEAKGLEFDDVILFNFFADSKCGHQWMLLKDVDFHLSVVKRYKDFDFINFESLDIDEEAQSHCEEPADEKAGKAVVANEDEEVAIELSLKKERSLVYRQFAQLCTELKFLYVAITRPKKVLIVYDADSALRRPLQDFWAKLGLIHVVGKEMLLDRTLLPPEVDAVLHKERVQTSEEQWRA